MAKILNIETSTRVCSVAVAIDGEIISLHETNVQNSHSEQITLLSNQAIKESNISFSDLDAVSVSKGPGSYTGLRIGVSTAKGFCYGLDIPLISVNTLLAMAYGIKQKKDKSDISENTLFCPMIDARRMEVYTALFNESLDEIKSTSALIIDNDSFKDYLDNHKLIIAGDGADKCKDTFGNSENVILIENFLNSSSFLCNISEQKFRDGEFEDTAYFEPYYLKDFVAGIPKVKGLRL